MEGEPATQEKSPSQAQRAVVLLREMIIFNQLPPGSMYLETELADMLGMSRTPVREAAIILEGQGLLEVRPRRGVRVLPIAPEDMEEIYSILIELEALAAYEVAMARPGPDELAVLRSLITQMEAALGTDDRGAWARADAEFHRHLVGLSGNRRLRSIVGTYSDQVHRARMLTLWMRPAPHKSNADHRRLIDAISAGEAEAARAIHREHRMEAKEMMIGLIRAHGLTSV